MKSHMKSRSFRSFRSRMFPTLTALSLGLCTLLPSSRDAGAIDVPDGFAVVDAFPAIAFPGDYDPVNILFFPDGRKLVIDRSGIVYTILADDTKPDDPFIDLSMEVAGLYDLGLLGAALDPDFENNRWVYFGYTVDPNEDGDDNDPGDDRFLRITRYQAKADDPDVADLSTRQVLIGETWSEGIPSLDLSHSMGDIQFGMDKSLLISCGEGSHFAVIDSGGFDPGGFGPGKCDPDEDIGSFRARSLNSMAGKILRIDKETGLGLPSNPFWDGDATSDRSRVWTYGLRNVYRMCVRPGTGSTDITDGNPGAIYAADVGCCNLEELNIIKSGGQNKGWPCKNAFNNHYAFPHVDETAAGNDSILCSSGTNDENPVLESLPQLWTHRSDGDISFPVEGWVGGAIIGGTFYQGGSYPTQYEGAYFFGDYTSTWIRILFLDENDNIVGWETFIDNANRPVAIQADPISGDLFYVSWSQSEVRRIIFTGYSSVEEEPDANSLTKGIAVNGYPNPFRRVLDIDFELPSAVEVSMRVYDPRGKLVRTLLENRSFAAGPHSLEWDARDGHGRRLESGVYFCRIEAGDQISSTKVVLR